MHVNIMKSAICCAALCLMASCRPKSSNMEASLKSDSSSTTQQVYSVKGVVKEIKIDGQTAVIEHEEVPGYMPAMTMPFKVKATNDLLGLQPGDAVSFRMVVTPQEGWIEQVRKIGHTQVNQLPSTESFRQVRDVEPLKAGDLMSD